MDQDVADDTDDNYTNRWALFKGQVFIVQNHIPLITVQNISLDIEQWKNK